MSKAQHGNKEAKKPKQPKPPAPIQVPVAGLPRPVTPTPGKR